MPKVDNILGNNWSYPKGAPADALALYREARNVFALIEDLATKEASIENLSVRTESAEALEWFQRMLEAMALAAANVKSVSKQSAFNPDDMIEVMVALSNSSSRSENVRDLLKRRATFLETPAAVKEIVEQYETFLDLMRSSRNALERLFTHALELYVFNLSARNSAGREFLESTVSSDVSTLIAARQEVNTLALKNSFSV